MTHGSLILISAPSGAGKTSLVEAIINQIPNLVVSVSHTTRAKRPGETDGVNYNFVDTATFQSMVKAGQFLEHALVFGNHYGTSAQTVDGLRAQGKIVILEIDWQGARQVAGIVEDALSIFILPPSTEALSQRLTARGQDSASTIDMRLSEAKLDMSQAGNYDYIVVNDDFAQAVVDITAILHSHQLKAATQITENPLIESILSD
ncbi:MAG: guanylate kinase [Limisphaerales bacterium]|jgi:guanylate kinase